MKLFKKNLINKGNAAQVAAYNRVLELCNEGPDNYIGTIGLEEAIQELLALLPTVDFIGFKSLSHYDETRGYHVYTLKIEQRLEKIERAMCSNNNNLHIIAENICKAQGIKPEYNGGRFDCIHISSGSRRCPEGYTLGACL